MKALVRVTDWERSARWKRVLAAFLRVAGLLGMVMCLLAVLGPPIGIWFTAQWMARKMPAVKVGVQPLKDYSINGSPGTAVSASGYEFEVPWKSSFTQKPGPKGWALVKFDSGQNILFVVAPNQTGFLSDAVHDPQLNIQKLDVMFADLEKLPAYDQYEALLNATPDRVHPFGQRKEAVRESTLMFFKAIAVGPGLSTGAFSFAMAGKRGFQVGNPALSNRVDLEIFSQDGPNVELIIEFPKAGPRMPQSDVNRIVTSLHKTPQPTGGK